MLPRSPNKITVTPRWSTRRLPARGSSSTVPAQEGQKKYLCSVDLHEMVAFSMSSKTCAGRCAAESHTTFQCATDFIYARCVIFPPTVD